MEIFCCQNPYEKILVYWSDRMQNKSHLWTWQRTLPVSTNLLDRSGTHELRRLYARGAQSCVREINTKSTFNVVLTVECYYNAKKKTCISPSYIFSINWHNLSTTSTMSRWYSWTTGKLYVVLLFRKNVK